jgi:fluoride exporter
MLLAIAAGGAAGSTLRYLISVWLAKANGAFPLGTFAVNVVGALLLGFLARVFNAPDGSPVWRAALTVGVCGGFTTFSTFSAECVALMQEGKSARAVAYAVASVVSGVLAIMLGLFLGQRFVTSRG